MKVKITYTNKEIDTDILFNLIANAIIKSEENEVEDNEENNSFNAC